MFLHPDSTGETFLNNWGNLNIVSVLDETEKLLLDLLVVILVFVVIQKMPLFFRDAI